MKFVLVSFVIFLAIPNLFGQNKSPIKLSINYPETFNADSICLIDYSSGRSIKRAFQSKQFIPNNFLSPPSKNQESTLGLFFKNNNFAITDTLYFVYGNKDCKIDFIDSFNLNRNNQILRLTNIYNFEELFSRYLEVNSYRLQKTNANINYQQKVIDNKLRFIKSNLKNPYINDLFVNFVVNDMEVDYASINNFYKSYYITTVKNGQLKIVIEKAIKAKMISISENIKVPPFVLKTLDNKLINSSDLNTPYVLLNFWATWCVPCREEIPALKKIRESFSEKNLQIISISMDNNLMQLQKMIEEKKLNWFHVFNEKSILKKFAINPIPHTFLINKDGFIVYNSLVRKNETVEMKILNDILHTSIKE